MRAGRLAIGIDIGGTKVVAGVVGADGAVLEQLRADTPDRSKAPTVIEDTLVDLACELVRRHGREAVVAAGIGAAGFVDETRALVRFAPHLSWRDEPVRDAVQRRIGVPVVIENDANAAAWAEFRFGVAAGAANVVCITLGTGIGGGLVLGGRLYRGSYGMAGEFGHMQVVPEGHRCPCGNRGCWEQYASGNALVRVARELAHADSPHARGLLELAAGQAERITGPLVTEAAQHGDRLAVELLADVGHWLGVGIANLAAAFDPDVVVVGGGVSHAGELLLAPARTAYARALTGRGYRPEARIVAARLGNLAGLVGAADLARSSVEGDA